jgi:sugar phosphate isomerase/epimerase
MAKRLGFSSMGQPEASFGRIQALALDRRMDFVELRVLEHSLDLPAYFQTHPHVPVAVPVRLLASSVHLAGLGHSDLEEFARFAVLADQLDVPYVRVFGSREGPVTSELLRSAAQGLKTLRAHLAGAGCACRILLETHGIFSAASSCAALNHLLDEPVEILWDTHHTWKLAGESPDQSWELLAPHVRHLHVKDSVRTAEGHRYVPQGQGEFPTAGLLGLLCSNGYVGGISLEWEKLWHPEIASLEEALDGFLEMMRP